MSWLSYAIASAAFFFSTGPRCMEAAAPPARSVSSSRQFIVYGNDPQLRGAICELAERRKRDVLRLLGIRDQWKTPVVIQAQSPEANFPDAPNARLQVSQTGAGLKFQLSLAKEAGAPDVERELLRAIYLELMYRSQSEIPAGTPYVEPPDWLLEGTLALAPDRDFTPLAHALATAAGNNVVALEDFLRQKRALLESPSQILYRAYSAALLSVLIEGPEGNAGLARFVAALAHSSTDPLADLTAHFPSLGGEREQWEKTWRSGVVRLAGRQYHQMLGCDETERELAELLRVNVRTANRSAVFGLEEFSQFVRDPAAVIDLKRLATELLVISGRANPLYRPIIAEYQQIVAKLLRRKTRGIPQRLAEARATRERLSRSMEAIEDYMNWFEATQSRTTSGAFVNYLKAAEETRANEPRRRDPISVYLDALESQF